jgi:hypothetical protein
MFTLDKLIWLLIAGILFVYWWNSGRFKGRARSLAFDHCQQFGLQLLDQSMVIRGIWPERTASGNLALRRSYVFEFSSTGEQRYQGLLVLQGMNLKSIELEAYKLPDSD